MYFTVFLNKDDDDDDDTNNTKRTAKVRGHPLNEAGPSASPGSRTPPHLLQSEIRLHTTLNYT